MNSNKGPYPRTRGAILPPVTWNGSLVNSIWRKGYGSPTVTTQLFSTSALCGTGMRMDDIVVPKYRQRSAKGELIVNPMSRLFRDCVSTPFSGEYYRSYVKDISKISTGQTSLNVFEYNNLHTSPNTGHWGSLTRDEKSFLQTQAVNEAFAAAKQRNVMGFVDIAEADKTADFIVGNLARAEQIIRHGRIRHRVVDKKKSLRKGELHYKPRSVDAKIADALGLHLEVHYGLIPLLASIEGLVKTFSQQVQPERQTFRGFAGDSGVYKNVKLVPIAGVITGTTVGNYSYTTKIEYKLSCRAGVVTDYKPSIRAMLGLEISDLPSAAYELIPLSFVLDWAWDMGTYISAIQPVKGFKSLASWAVNVVDKITTLTYKQPYCVQDYYSPSFIYQAIWSEVNTEVTAIERTKVRIPNTTPRLPEWDPVAVRSLTHMISGLALGFLGLKRALSSKIRK